MLQRIREAIGSVLPRRGAGMPVAAPTNPRPLSRAQYLYRAQEAFGALPVRPGGAAESTIPAARAARLWQSSGVLRDSRGLPRYDAADWMRPVAARGLYADHGNYHEMWRADGAIYGVTSMVASEVLRQPVRFEIPEDASPEEKQLCALCERYFGFTSEPGWLHGGYRQLMAHLWLAHIYGFSLLAWDARPDDVIAFDGRDFVVPRRLVMCAPWSVQAWLYSASEDLIGVVQCVQTGNGKREVDIPINRCLLHTHNPVSGNPEGTSDLRCLWVPYAAKRDTLIRWQRAEATQFAGVTQLIETADADGGRLSESTAQDQETLEQAVRHLVNGTLSQITVPLGWRVTQDHPQFQINSRTPEMDWCNDQIYLGLSAIVYGLSGSRAASMSLAETAEQLFRAKIEGSTDELLATVQGVPGQPWTGLVQWLADLNYAPGVIRRLPQARRTNGQLSLTRFSTALRELAQYRLVTITPEDEALIRRVAQLPALSLDRIRQIRDAAVASEISQRGTQVRPEQPS